MKKRILCFALVLAMLFVSACSPKDSSQTSSAGQNQKKEYTMLYSSEGNYNYLKSWWPTLLELMVDGLVQFDKYGVTTPNLATEWTRSDDGLVYTFKLREGQQWYTHDKKEYAEITADDFIASAKYILNPENSSLVANLVYDFVENAKEYFEGTVTDFSQVGIKAKDKYTVEYTLKTPCTYFMKLAGNNCFYPVNQKFLDEVGEKFATTAETILYSGPYIMTTWLSEDKKVLDLNEKYWDKDNMHISKFTLKFNKDNTLQGELFQRGEIDQASIPAELMQEWVNDTEGKGKWAVRNFYRQSSWFWGLNFDPRYEGNGVEDFKIAVNNLDFRKSLYFGLDRVAIAETIEMFTPEDKVIKTIVPKTVFSAEGVDYTQIGDLKAISDAKDFDVDKALGHKKSAMDELKGKVTFPIKLILPYSTGSSDNVNSAQVFEQQIEKALGTDYVDVILEAYPPTNFYTKIHDAGLYSVAQQFWGADYADPSTFTDTFNENIDISKRYGKPFLSEGYQDSNGKHKYTNLLMEGLAENLDVKTRYEKLAKAEAFLLNEALLMPNYVGDGVWWLCKLDPHEGNNNSFGRSVSIYKGKKVMDKPMTRDEYLKAEEEYLKEKEEALKNAKNQK